jgi:ankyrin repeat protein
MTACRSSFDDTPVSFTGARRARPPAAVVCAFARGGHAVGNWSPDDGRFSLVANAAGADEELLLSIRYRDMARFQAALDAGANVRANGAALNDTVVLWGDTAAITALLAKGADVNAADGRGTTPLLWALQSPHYDSDAAKREPLVKLLLSHGAAVNAADKSGSTPMDTALKLGHMPLVEALARAGGRLPPDALFKALAWGTGTNVPLIQYLMAHAKDLDLKLRNASGDTPAHLAMASPDRMFLLRWLVERGADLQARDGRQNTLLAKAALADNIPAMDYLFGKGLKLDAVNSDGGQAAHMGAYGGRYTVMKWLVDHGADLQARDGWERRPPGHRHRKPSFRFRQGA